MSEEERTPQEWAREVGVRLHGMDAEHWDAYVRYLDSQDELGQAFRALVAEGQDLGAALRADKWVTPEDPARRVELQRGLRDLRTRRLADLQARRAEIDDQDEPEEES